MKRVPARADSQAHLRWELQASQTRPTPEGLLMVGAGHSGPAKGTTGTQSSEWLSEPTVSSPIRSSVPRDAPETAPCAGQLQPSAASQVPERRERHNSRQRALAPSEVHRLLTAQCAALSSVEHVQVRPLSSHRLRLHLSRDTRTLGMRATNSDRRGNALLQRQR
jgi:hypothetical protein